LSGAYNNPMMAPAEIPVSKKVKSRPILLISRKVCGLLFEV
jgi:hypothetical protein